MLDLAVFALGLSAFSQSEALANSPLNWSSPQLISPTYSSVAPIRTVGCASASLCVAGDELGNILTSTNPAGGAGAWSVAPVDGEGVITAVSCPTTSFCLAGDSRGDVLTSTNPTGGAGAWNATVLPGGHRISTVACPSASLCIVGTNDASGKLFVSTAPRQKSIGRRLSAGHRAPDDSRGEITTR